MVFTVCGFLFGLGVVFCCLVACLVCFPHGRDLLFLLNCVRIVCNLERPSELSWRARHGEKKRGGENMSAEHVGQVRGRKEMVPTGMTNWATIIQGKVSDPLP